MRQRIFRLLNFEASIYIKMKLRTPIPEIRNGLELIWHSGFVFYFSVPNLI